MSSWRPGETLESIEKDAILQAYRFHEENKTQTSSALGISIRTLDAKLEKYKEDAKVPVKHPVSPDHENDMHMIRANRENQAKTDRETMTPPPTRMDKSSGQSGEWPKTVVQDREKTLREKITRR